MKCTKCKIARISLAAVAAIIVFSLSLAGIKINALTCRCPKCHSEYDCDGHHSCSEWS